MTDPVLLDFHKHGKLRLIEQKDFSKHKAENFVPVVFQEFAALATEFPLVFVRNSRTGDFVPSAMMGLNKGVNLFCQTSEWSPAFIPTSFTIAPLSVSRLGSNASEADIAIYEESSLLSEVEGEAIFSDDGQTTEYFKKRRDNLVKITEQSMQAIEVCRYLAEKRLLATRALKLQYTDSSPTYEVDGVFTVDEEALEKLSNEEFLELRKRGFLPLIYSHLISLQQMHKISRLQYQADLRDSRS